MNLDFVYVYYGSSDVWEKTSKDKKWFITKYFQCCETLHMNLQTKNFIDFSSQLYGSLLWKVILKFVNFIHSTTNNHFYPLLLIQQINLQQPRKMWQNECKILFSKLAVSLTK